MTNGFYLCTISSAIVVLFVLIGLLLFQKVSGDESFAPYRRAKRYLIFLFLAVAIDFILSVIVNRLGLGESWLDTVVDVLCYTPVAIFFMWFVGTLLDKDFDCQHATKRDVAIWVGTSVAMIANLFVSSEVVSTIIFVVVAVTWGLFIVVFAVRIVRLFKSVMHKMDNFYSDNFRVYTRPLQNSAQAFIAWGVFSPLAAVLSPGVNAVYIAIGVVVFIFVFNTFVSDAYVGYELMARAKKGEAAKAKNVTSRDMIGVIGRLRQWSEEKGYRRQGITIEGLAQELDSDSATVTRVINHHFCCSFRVYISRLRVRDAQRLLVHMPDRTEEEIAKMVGFKNAEELNDQLGKIANVSSSSWRKGVLGYMDTSHQ